MDIVNSVEIESPPEKVWNVLTDFKKTHLWVKEKIKFIPLDKYPLRSAFRFKIFIYRTLMTLEYKGEIQEFEKYKRMGILLQGGVLKGSDMILLFQLNDLNKKTKFDYDIKMKQEGLMSMMSPLSNFVGNRETDQYFINLKALVEKT